jgi:hypothetical protein
MNKLWRAGTLSYHLRGLGGSPHASNYIDETLRILEIHCGMPSPPRVSAASRFALHI